MITPIQVTFISGSMLPQVSFDNIIEYNTVCHGIFYGKNSLNCTIVFYRDWKWLVFK